MSIPPRDTDTTETPCWCATCDEARRKAELDAGGSFSAYISRYMILCPDCGNKRCPKATHHAHHCTGSNDSGQSGSRYGIAPIFPLSPQDEDHHQEMLRLLGRSE